MLKQKLYAIILLIITIVIMAMGFGTIAIFTIPAVIHLLFTKRNYIY